MEEQTKVNKAAEKPLGILIVAIYTAVTSVIYFMSGMADLFITDASVKASRAFTNASLSFGILGLIASYGFISMKKWSHNLMILTQILFIGLGMIIILRDKSGGDVFHQAVCILINIGIMIYLFQPKVKDIYR